MKRILLDTNVVLDFALKRELFYENAQAIVVEIANGSVEGYITASMATDIFYVLQKTNGHTFASHTFDDLLILFNVLSVYKEDVYLAHKMGWNDFEDALQTHVAMRNEMDAIVTRNTKDFASAAHIQILTPQEFIAKM
ncbi:MAG: PIN domain-containing protein [Bacteroidales bacterium]|jgi:predicted nucleic acid-binding protein|nr:PIN domain-containing protein [Bacteroidales bacterium]